MRSRKRPIAVDLCSGAGGMSLGFEQAGFDVLAAIEIDPVHCATHQYNFPYSKIICSDITKVTGEKIRLVSKIGDLEVDVVFGGLPCQGFSEIGKRLVNDPRNTLAKHFVRIVSELDAKFFVIENVRGFTFERYGKIFKNLISSFKKAGYVLESEYKILNAAQFGVPQKRERLFLLGCKRELYLPKYPSAITIPINYTGILTLPESTLPPCPTVSDAIKDLPNVEDYPELLERDWVEANYGLPSEYGKLLRGLAKAKDDYSYIRQYDSAILTSSLRPNHSFDCVERFKNASLGRREERSRLHRLHPHGVSTTLRAGTSRNNGSFTAPRPIHPILPRCITVREAARLHSYPDWFRFHVTNWHGFRQIGNSVPPFLAKAVASEIIKALGIQPRKPLKSYQLGEERWLKFSIEQAAEYYDVDPNIIKPRARNSKKSIG